MADLPDALEPLEALERIIVLNCYDRNRADQSKQTQEIERMARLWLDRLDKVPNVWGTHKGARVHLLEQIYHFHMESGIRPHPLTSADMLKAWDDLQTQWAQDAQTPEHYLEEDEFFNADGTRKPLSPEQQSHRAELCRQSRAMLGLPLEGSVAPPAKPFKPEAHDKLHGQFTHMGAVAGELDVAKQAQNAKAQAQAQAKKAEGMITAKPPRYRPTHEDAGVALDRLGDDAKDLIQSPVDQIHFSNFNREFQEYYKRLLTLQEMQERFPEFLEQRKAESKKRLGGSK